MPNRETDGHKEGFGIVSIYASACCITYIVGIDDGTAGVDGVTGLRVDGRSLVVIAESPHTFLVDLELRAAMGEQAIARVSGVFAWDGVAEATSEIFHKRG